MLNDNSRQSAITDVSQSNSDLLFSSKMMDDNAVSCGQCNLVKKRRLQLDWYLAPG